MFTFSNHPSYYLLASALPAFGEKGWCAQDQPETHPSTPNTGSHFLSSTQGHSSSNFPFFPATLFHLHYEVICMTIKHSVKAASSLDPLFCPKLLPFLCSPWNQHFSSVDYIQCLYFLMHHFLLKSSHQDLVSLTPDKQWLLSR